MDILRGLPQIGIYLGVNSMQSRVFSLGKRTEWGTFLGVVFFFVFFFYQNFKICTPWCNAQV